MIGALMMREMATRYGREGMGFLWIVLEPLAFCLGIILLWSLIKPPYEHGIRVGAFAMTGYMCLLMMRYVISQNLNAIQANVGLMYHRQVKILHVFVARGLLEMASTTSAFIILYVVLFLLGQVSFPQHILTLYAGWALLAWVSFGFSLVLSVLALRFDVVERLSNLALYALIPFSGVFFMLAFVPEAYREMLLYVPFTHAVEMVRHGAFGDSIPFYYNPTYPLIWGAALNLAGLVLLEVYKDRVDAE